MSSKFCALREAELLCLDLGFNFLNVLGKSRKRDIVRHRHICAIRLRDQGFTLQDIGFALGNRRHPTIVNALKKNIT